MIIYWRAVCGESRTYGSGTGGCIPFMDAATEFHPAWPNDLLYVFPVTMLGALVCIVGLSVLAPTQLGEPADPFNTPLEILPEWYLINY